MDPPPLQGRARSSGARGAHATKVGMLSVTPDNNETHGHVRPPTPSCPHRRCHVTPTSARGRTDCFLPNDRRRRPSFRPRPRYAWHAPRPTPPRKDYEKQRRARVACCWPALTAEVCRPDGQQQLEDVQMSVSVDTGNMCKGRETATPWTKHHPRCVCFSAERRQSATTCLGKVERFYGHNFGSLLPLPRYCYFPSGARNKCSYLYQIKWM